MAAIWAVLVAAGSGQRMGAGIPKQYLQLAGRKVIEHSLDALVQCPSIDGIYLVVSHDCDLWLDLDLEHNKPVHVVYGGKERAHSVVTALECLSPLHPADTWALVHDAARPCVSEVLLETLIAQLADDPVGGLLAIPVQDTLKQVVAGRVERTLDRTLVWQAQTPQMFRLGVLQNAYRMALEKGLTPTDEALAVEIAGHSPRLVEGNVDNLKITRPEDLALAEFILRRRQEGVRS